MIIDFIVKYFTGCRKYRNKNDGKQNKHTKQSEEVETKREYQMSELF